MMIEKNGHSRWAAWEFTVLSKVGDRLTLQKIIAERSAEADGDQDEAMLVIEQLRNRLKVYKCQPDECYVYIPSTTIAEWIRDIRPDKGFPNKVSSYLTTLGIPELRKAKRSSGGCGWYWRGARCPTEAKPTPVSLHNSAPCLRADDK